MKNPMNFFNEEGLSCIGQLTLFDEPTLPMNVRFIQADVFNDEDEKFIGFHLKSRD